MTISKSSLLKLITVIFLTSFYSYSQNEIENKSQYPLRIGDINFDKNIDKENFELCNANHIFQYFNNSNGFEYKGEKLAIEKKVTQQYKSDFLKDETGLIRIQFVVNCMGETDRFRLIAMDENYNQKEFKKSITEQLLKIVKELNGWKTKKIQEKEIDYYQYLIFKIENGQLKEILP